MATKKKDADKPADDKGGKANLAVTSKNFTDSFATKSFDDLYNMDEKEVDKEIQFHAKRKSKAVQLAATINKTQQLIVEAETAYRKSLIDPLADSVKLAVQIEVLRKEEKIATKILKQLFPDNPLANVENAG